MSAQPLDSSSILAIPAGSPLVVVGKDNEVIERVTFLRPAGHYRSGAGDTFAVKDANNKFRLRSHRQLGLGGTGTTSSFLATDFDAATMDSQVIDLNESVNA